MARWDHTIDLSNFYGQYEIDSNFTSHANKVITKLEESGLIDECYLQQLRDARDVDDLDEWDEAWNDVYDYADENRIWLKVLA